MLLLHLHIFGGFVNAHASENTFALLQLQTSASVSVIWHLHICVSHLHISAFLHICVSHASATLST